MAIVVKPVVQELGIQLGTSPLSFKALTGHRVTLACNTGIPSILRDVCEHEFLVVPLQWKKQFTDARRNGNGR